MRFSGVPMSIRPTALATSSAAIGWKSTGGSRTVVPSVASSAMRLTNSKNCVAWQSRTRPTRSRSDKGVTEDRQDAGPRAHADDRRRLAEVAEKALEFLKRFTSRPAMVSRQHIGFGPQNLRAHVEVRMKSSLLVAEG